MYCRLTCVGESHVGINKWSHKTRIHHFFALQAGVKTFIKGKIARVSVDKRLRDISSGVLPSVTKFWIPVIVKKSPDKKLMPDTGDVVFRYTKTHLSRAIHAI